MEANGQVVVVHQVSVAVVVSVTEVMEVQPPMFQLEMPEAHTQVGNANCIGKEDLDCHRISYLVQAIQVMYASVMCV